MHVCPPPPSSCPKYIEQNKHLGHVNYSRATNPTHTTCFFLRFTIFVNQKTYFPLYAQKHRLSNKKTKFEGICLGCSSEAEHLCSMYETLGSIPRKANQRKYSLRDQENNFKWQITYIAWTQKSNYVPNTLITRPVLSIPLVEIPLNSPPSVHNRAFTAETALQKMILKLLRI